MARAPLLSAEEVAAYAGVPPKTIYVCRTNRTGPPGIRVGRFVRFRQADVDAWLDQQADQPQRPVAVPTSTPGRRRGSRAT